MCNKTKDYADEIVAKTKAERILKEGFSCVGKDMHELYEKVKSNTVSIDQFMGDAAKYKFLKSMMAICFATWKRTAIVLIIFPIAAHGFIETLFGKIIPALSSLKQFFS